MQRLHVTAAALTLAAVLLRAGLAVAGAPTDQVRQYTDQVQRILDDPTLPAAERRDAVRRVAFQAFDMTETARRALGRHWQARTPEEQKEFVALFAELLERTYIGRIDQYRGERVEYTGEQVDGDYATVRARLLTRQGTEVPLEARLQRRGDRWLIYDVVIENVSLVANYRAQFDRIIRTSSFRDLVNRLRTRTDELSDKKT